MTNLNNKTSVSKPLVPYEEATGSPKYGLTNDYMFRVVFQNNELARKGLIASVLHMKPEQIQSVIIRNPIKLGESIDNKQFVFDLEVMLNNNHVLNLEMQMTNQLNWQDRSLSYLCRSFDQLYKGEEYTEAKPASHIGFLNFAPFPESPEFNACYKLLNIKNHSVYSDKFTLHVVDLTHIELATDEDKAWSIDYWARLFTATTWEDLKMIAEKDIHMKAAAEEMYMLSADEMIQQQCRARNEYYKELNTHLRNARELEETKKALEASEQDNKVKDSIIEEQIKEIESLKKQLAKQNV